MNDIVFWIGFHIFVFLVIWVDLVVLNKDQKHSTVKQAGITAIFWVIIGLAFSGVIYWWTGHEGYHAALAAKGAASQVGSPMEAVMLYLTGYLLELSLSVDNLFVFLMIFQYFAVPLEYRRRALLWGIVAAIVMRGTFIIAGAALVSRFEWVLYILGALLIYTGLKMFKSGDDEIEPEKNPALLLIRKFMKVTPDYVEDRFFTKIQHAMYATPLFVVLMVINTTDVMFATDSIPAILGITQETLIVYTSNIMAICGLRALYFALQGLFDVFHLLKYGLAVILSFIGIKMLVEAPIEHHFHLTQTQMTIGSLSFVLGVLVLSVVASVMFPKKEEEATVAA